MNTARRLSEDLRHGQGGFLAQRRGVALLSLTTISAMTLVALYQLGIVKHLPQPAGRWFKTKTVHASDQAYALLGVPDAVLGLGSYAVTLGLAAMGGSDRAQTCPWIPLALAGKAFVDAAQAAKLTRDSWVKHRAFSIYSLAAGACALGSFALVLPEAAAAIKSSKRPRP